MTNGKKLLKIALIVLCAVAVFYIIFYLSILSATSETKSSDNVNEYAELLNSVKGSNVHMPDVEELGDYQKICINVKRTENFMRWKIDTISVQVAYDKTNFDKEINELQAAYVFLSENKQTVQDISATVKGYDIKIVEKEEMIEGEYCYYYPKCFMMIGIDEQHNTIIYMYHYDIDLDEIKNLDKFVEKYFSFEQMK